jgi:Na+/glutamate symporter
VHCSRIDTNGECVGYGFPTTFGLVAAAIVGVVVIQLLVLRDKKKAGTADGPSFVGSA